MRVLIISQYWAPENGVPQRRWTWLTELLRRKGHDVTVIAPKPHYERAVSWRSWVRSKGFAASFNEADNESGEMIIRSGFLPASQSLTGKILNQASVALGQLRAIPTLKSLVPGFKPDIVIGTVPAIPTSVVTIFASVLFRAPYVIDLRDAWPDLLANREQWNKSLGTTSIREKIFTFGAIQFLSNVTRHTLNYVLKKSSVVMVTSSFLGDDLRNRPELITKNGKSVNTVVLRNVFPPETDYKRTGGSPRNAGPLRILYAGTLGRAQNLDNAIKAAAICSRKGRPVSLKMVGAGAARERVQHLSMKYGVDVDFISRQPAEQLRDHYDWADTALVHLTDWDALSMVVPSKTYELMGAGLHISAVVQGETAELVRTLGAGDVVAPESPLDLAELWIRLSDDRSLLLPSEIASRWVENERTVVSPRALNKVIKLAEDSDDRWREKGASSGSRFPQPAKAIKRWFRTL